MSAICRTSLFGSWLKGKGPPTNAAEDLDALIAQRDAREERNRQEAEELTLERVRLLRIRAELAQIRRDD